MSQRVDVAVLGMGPGGEAAAWRLLEAGRSVAVIERELIGGECAYWGCVPSKTLIRPVEARRAAGRVAGLGEPDLNWAEVAAYRNWMIRDLDDTHQVAGLEKSGATVVKASGRLVAPGVIEAGGEHFEAGDIVISTGAEATLPPIDGLAETEVWTNREATSMNVVPERAVVIGGGPVGIELGQLLCRLGAQVGLVELADHLMPHEDPQVGAFIHPGLVEDGIDVRVGRRPVRARRDGPTSVVELDDGSVLSGDVVLVGAGRAPRLADIGLEKVGIEPTAKGVPVDGSCQAGEGLWAIGDVTGIMPFTHVAKYQGRIAADNILGLARRADYRAIPRVVFSDPEIAAVGLSEEQARLEGFDVAAAVVDLPDAIARPYTYERVPRGRLAVIVDRARRVLVGAWAVAPLASEWIHVAALAIQARLPLEVLLDNVAQFPTYTESYLSALERIVL
jgi:dihydrolipoamide dehydrogenase